MIDQLTIERILDAANIVDVISEFVTLRKRGVNYVGLCPFHNEKTPSFYVSPSKGICKCFSCGKGGNAIHFLMEHEQLSFTQAAEWLADKYGIPIQKHEQTDEEKALQNERESLFIVNNYAGKYFADTLHNSEMGRAIGMAYLRKRGFHDDIIKKFQLGYCTEESVAFSTKALKDGYRKEYILQTGLSYEKEDGTLRDRFRGRVIFPIHSLSGKIIAFGGRIMQSDAKAAKYINSPESIIYTKNKELYGLYFAKQSIVRKNRCFLVEGYADVISMVQSGVENVVASCGTSLTPGQIRLIHRFTNNITVLYDGDKAGIKASIRGIDMLLAEGMNVKVLLLPDGEDPDSFAQGHNATAFQEYIEKHQVDFIRFKLQLLSDEAGDDPMARAGLIKEITRSIAVIQDPIVRSVYIKDCSQQMQIDEALLINDVNKQQREQYQEQHKPSYSPSPETAVSQQPQDDSSKSAEEAPIETPQLSAEDILREQIRALKREGRGLIMEKERLLAQLLVRSGEKTIKYSDDEKEIMSIGEYIIGSLDYDEIEFCHPIYKKMIELYREHFSDPDFISERYFLSNPDNFISLTAASLLEDRYQISEIFKENKIIKEEDRLAELTRHLLSDFKLAIMHFEIKRIEKELQQPEIYSDSNKLKQLQSKYKDLLSTRNFIAKKLGDRVINI